MIASCIEKGAEIGLTAFFSLFVFALCLGVFAGIIAIMSRAFGSADGEDR